MRSCLSSFVNFLTFSTFPKTIKSIHKFCMYYHLNGNCNLMKIHDPLSSEKSGSDK